MLLCVVLRWEVTMGNLDRRTFVAMSIATASSIFTPQVAGAAGAAAQCVSNGLPFLPNRLTVSCATRRNFRAFRQDSDYLGLAGVVSMTFVTGGHGSYEAGNLFLFPWLKPKGKALGQGIAWPAAVPTNATLSVNARPIPDLTLPPDEFFCHVVLQAPLTSFLGFQVDIPFGAADARRPWFTNVDKLADGQGVGIDWTSANLNNSWFGGSNWIPNSETCGGKAWRQVIIDGLDQASVGAC
jgi:hypothetical protein